MGVTKMQSKQSANGHHYRFRELAAKPLSVVLLMQSLVKHATFFYILCRKKMLTFSLVTTGVGIATMKHTHA